MTGDPTAEVGEAEPADASSPGEPSTGVDDRSDGEGAYTPERGRSLGMLAPALRVQPQQQRSREHVERILNVAAEQLAEMPQSKVTVQTISEGAGIAPATLYRYFVDKRAIVMALTRRDLDEMGETVMSTLLTTERHTLADTARVALRAYRDTYARKPLFVKIYLRGRHNDSMADYGAQYNRGLAELLQAFVVDEGLARPGMPFEVALLVIELGDRLFQTAFADDGTYDAELIDVGIEMIVDALQRFAMPGR